jgi:uncharacterized membrane protein
MDLYDWLLFLHVLSAFILVASLTALWALVLGMRSETASIDPASAMSWGRFAGTLVGVGMMGTIVFGIWLAIDVDGYELWDGWILASLILWAIGGAAGGQAGKQFMKADGSGRSAGIRLQTVNTVAVLLILILMIWKPGA